MRVKLTASHEHKGQRHEPGAIIDIDDNASAQWLIDLGRAVAAATDDAQGRTSRRRAKED